MCKEYMFQSIRDLKTHYVLTINNISASEETPTLLLKIRIVPQN